MPNLEVRCSKNMESFFLENDGELLRKLHALLQSHQSLDPVTEEPKNTVLPSSRRYVAGAFGGVLHCR